MERNNNQSHNSRKLISLQDLDHEQFGAEISACLSTWKSYEFKGEFEGMDRYKMDAGVNQHHSSIKQQKKW